MLTPLLSLHSPRPHLFSKNHPLILHHALPLPTRTPQDLRRPSSFAMDPGLWQTSWPSFPVDQEFESLSSYVAVRFSLSSPAQSLPERFQPWQIIGATLTMLYAARHTDKLLGLNGPLLAITLPGCAYAHTATCFPSAPDHLPGYLVSKIHVERKPRILHQVYLVRARVQQGDLDRYWTGRWLCNCCLD